MKTHSILLSSVMLLSLACSNTQTDHPALATIEHADSTVNSTTSIVADEERDVLYYYKKYADVDSEDPAIGVGERVIVSKDLEKGIIKYKMKEAFNGENPIQTIQLWHLDGFDYIDYPGGQLLIDGESEFPIYVEEAPMKLAMKVIDNRTARGGECDYAASPDIKVRNNKLCVILTCSDDPNFSETIGTISLKNGKLIVSEI
ncbi:MAG: hypothetical protein ACO1N0_06065 [Fluviicola sp.]